MRAVVALSSSISSNFLGCRVGRSGSTSCSDLVRPPSAGACASSSALFVPRAGRRASVSTCQFAQPQRSQRQTRFSVVCCSASPVSEQASVKSGVDSMELLAKAAVGKPGQLGDCPFTQRVMLTLEEKHIKYDATYIDVSNKPQWFLEANPEGKVPVIKHEGKWIADSDVITALLEDLYPEPSLKVPDEKKSVGSSIFGAFIGHLKSKDSSDGTEAALLKVLVEFNEYLQQSGPFVNGEKICSVDLALAPKLFHMQVALGHYKQWTVPKEVPEVSSYMNALFSRESFLKTKAKEEDVIKGWEAKVLGA
ncbi:glutathione dehydrogenase/transferase [Marchantia polymorpha subsp. ruderalis]